MADTAALRSISGELNNSAYGRLRVGIGRPKPDFQGDIADFVLQAFALEEARELDTVLASASQAVEPSSKTAFPER